MFHCLLWLIVVLNLPIGAPTTTTTSSSLISSNDIPSISHLLVYASNLETVILFEPKHGWELSDETKIRLYITGHNLQNSSLAFSAFQDDCSPNEFISSIYPLSSAPVIQLDVILKKSPRGRSSTYLCLLTPASLSASSNNNSVQNMTQLTGPYYTFVREPSRLPFAAKICLILMLFIVSGFFSGLNLGLMSLSVNDLRLIAESEDTSLRYYAKRVLPLRKRGNFLLCSIVLANVLVNSLGTVLLDSLVHGLFAVIGSTIMIVLMGEIIPQAICSRYGLVIGAHTHVITWACMIITGVISYPLGFILDKILGQEVTASYTRDQIAGMLTRISADIEKPELDVITGVLSLRKKTVKEAMTWLPDVYMLDKDRKTDAELLLDVHKHGFSRIPVYAIDKSNVIGIVKLRDFALITPEQYHLTVKHLMEFHTHPFGYAKTTDSLYNLMQEFLKSQWHIALVQELRNEEDNVDPIFQTVGLITLEDVIEEMLQREIIEEADFFTDNRRKIRRKRAKTMDYTALVKRPMKGPTINPQLKVAVFQFLSTNVHQFTSGFISPEILKPLLNYNIYAMIKRPPNQSSNSIYLYKKGFRYELFTLVMQGNATLESGVERIMSTVGPFSFFGGAALASEETTVKDIQLFLDRLLGSKSKSNVTNIPVTTTATTTDELSPTFMPDYNLIVNTELQVMQIHRLVWLAAVRATQRQRGNDPQFRRMPPEQLLSNALDEIVALVAHVPIDKNNLTNFQRVVNEKELAHHHSKRANGNALPSSGQQSSSVFEVIHSLSSGDAVNSVEVNQSQETNVDENPPSNLQDNDRRLSSSAVFICNPLLLTIPSYEQTNGNGTNNGNYNHSSSNSSDPNENGFNSSMHINRMFDEENEQMNEVEEHEHLIAQGRSANDMSNIWDLPTTSTPASPYPLQYARSDTNLVITISPDTQDETIDNENQLRTRNRRARSMLSSTKCSPS